MLDSKLDKYDIALSVSSGAITAALDVLWVNDISLADAFVAISESSIALRRKVFQKFLQSNSDYSMFEKLLLDPNHWGDCPKT